MHAVTSEAHSLRKRLLSMPRLYKRLIWVVADFALLSVVLLGALAYHRQVLPVLGDLRAVHLMAPAISVVTLLYFRLYRVVTRYIAYGGNVQVILGMSVSVALWVLLASVAGSPGLPRPVAVIYLLGGTLGILVVRHLAGWLLARPLVVANREAASNARIPVVIFGTGPTAVQLFQSMQRENRHEVVAFIDSSAACSGQFVGGVKVHQLAKLPRLIERAGVKEVLLAVPQAARHETRAVVELLQNYPVTVKRVPGLNDIASGRVSLSHLKPLAVEDLLGRDAIPPDSAVMVRSTRGKSVLITGAGGSVGSELARRVLHLGPAVLVLLDLSEEALYTIEMELSEDIARLPQADRPQLVAVLGSVLDHDVVDRTLAVYHVQTIYHAAAYKHVPIVESNPLVGLLNNTFGTEAVARLARHHKVERFVLISTDKAVRPTNVMGASKRLSELVLQSVAGEGGNTIFTMVRFGNVLDSSGSVVPRFRKQIEAGGPVTVTHPDMIRYFMTIREAADLVIQAGSMARGGELFVLDMGEPVKIDMLARLMITLVGRDVRSDANPNGDIEIVYTGLRPGEKLDEELLVSSAKSNTEHSRIFRSDDPFPSIDDIRGGLEILRGAIEHQDTAGVLGVLEQLVEGYTPSKDIVAVAAAQASTVEAWVPQPRTLH